VAAYMANKVVYIAETEKHFDYDRRRRWLGGDNVTRQTVLDTWRSSPEGAAVDSCNCCRTKN